MNYAIKLNALVNSLWPDHYTQSHHLISQQSLNQLDVFLQSLSLNEFHQIIELCTQKTLFVVLQKSDIIIKKHISQKAQLLKEINSFFQNWVLPQFPYNLKRSYDVNCLENYFQSSIGKVLGKILKQISKSNYQSDWDMISSFMVSLGEKSHFYQILIILGYFCEIENLQEEFEEYDSVRQILKNFEYEIIPKVMEMVIRNVSFCKETLQVVELETMSTQLSLMGEEFSGRNKDIRIQEPSSNQSINQSKIKYLKMNFEILRKVVEFNYNMEFKDNNKINENNELSVSIEEQKMRRNSFPQYMIRLFLESGLIGSLYEVAQILIGFKLPVKDLGLGFGQIVLDLINKIIRTKIEELKKQLKQKLMMQVLKGQSILMMKISEKSNIKESLLIKIIRGNIKLLKNMTLKDILSINQGQQWVILTLKLIQTIMTVNTHIDTDNYLIYKILSLTKQLVYQTILYEIPSINQIVSNEIFISGIKVQEIYIRSFVSSSKLLQENKYYNLEDLKTKRDRHFHNLKTLSQIHLPQFNTLLLSILPTLNSIQSAANYLLLVSYFISPEFTNCGSYYYLSHNGDVTTFKKLTIGNGLLLTQQLLKPGSQQKSNNLHSKDASLLFIQKLLQIYLEHQIPIAMTFAVTDTPLPINELMCQIISNKPKLLTSLFLHIFRILHVKAQKLTHSQDQSVFHFYFQTFIKYLTLLVNQNQLLQPYEIISIQCELKQYFIEFKTYLRTQFKLQERKYLSQITALLNYQPQIPEKSQIFKQKMSLLYHTEIEELLRLLQYDPKDWIGICYEIGGFLQLINNQKTYFKIITFIGHQFFNKIFMSCIDNINLQKIKLLTYFMASFLDFTQDEKIKNLNFWLQFVKPIFLSWVQLFKILSNEKFQQQGWSEICYPALRNFLQNENFNFYMLKRYPKFEDIISNFTSGLVLFMNANLQKKIMNLQDTNFFKAMRVIFRYLSDYYIQDKTNNFRQDFLNLVGNLIEFVKCKLNFVNNRKCENLTQSIEGLKALEVILEYFSEFRIKYSYKTNLLEMIQSFINQQKPILKCLQSQLFKFTVNYEKYIKFSSQKYRRSQMDLLINTSKIICELCDIQRSSKSQNVNQESTMSSSEQDNLESNGQKSQEKHNKMLINSMNSLEKQFIWFDIQGEKQIIDY